MNAPTLFDRKLLIKRRERAWRSSAMPDFLRQRVLDDMSERLEGVRRDFPRVLGLNVYSMPTAKTAPDRGGLFVAMDASQAWLEQSAAPKVQADEEFLPFKDGSFDLILSVLSLHLVNDLPGALIQLRRALSPDGLFIGAILGGQTLEELREAFMQAEIELEGGASPRVAPMADIRDYGMLLQRAGFALPVIDRDLVTVTYPSPLALMLELRAMGMTNILTERRKTPLRRATLQRAIEIYSKRFSASKDRVHATFEIIHISGWAPHESQQKPLKPGSAQSRLADALGVKEHRLKNS